MTERIKFEKDDLLETLASISANLDSEITIYLIGGLAMIFHGFKAVTKDVDLIIDSDKKLRAFLSASEKAELNIADDLSEEYQDLEAQIVLIAENDVRLDVFYKQVCGGLLITSDMKERSSKVYEMDKLIIMAMSKEDIFLFKSITLRDDDLADMATIAGAELDWNVIEFEARNQPDSKKWLQRLSDRLLDLKDEYGVDSPLI